MALAALAAHDDVQVIGAANMTGRSSGAATLTPRERGGKVRYAINVTGDSIVVGTDPKQLGQAVASAIAEEIRERISSITATVAPATVRAREVAAKAFAEGKSWAQKRYAGGRIGAMPPGQSDRLFNDSGRLAKSIAVGATKDGEFVVNVAANRLNPETLNGGEIALRRIYNLLKQHVPELADPTKLMMSNRVRGAVTNRLREMVQKADERTVELKKQRMQAAIGLVRALVSI